MVQGLPSWAFRVDATELRCLHDLMMMMMMMMPFVWLIKDFRYCTTGGGTSVVELGEGGVNCVASLESTESSPQSDDSALDPGRQRQWRRRQTQRRHQAQLVDQCRGTSPLGDLGHLGDQRQQRTAPRRLGHILQQRRRHHAPSQRGNVM